MSVAHLFEAFCGNLTMSAKLRSSIAERVGRMVRCLNEDFRDTSSTSTNSYYVGSYGRNTAIPSVSDVDVLFVLPYSIYLRFNSHGGNKQSGLLQAMRSSIRRTYPQTQIAADGQVVVLNFTDNIKVEILGAFLNKDGSYTFPDANDGGTWRTCRPKHELDAFSKRDRDCNSNLVQLGRMARAWRDHSEVPMSGMLIDTLAYQFMESWSYRDKSYLYYDYLTRDFFAYLAARDSTQRYWLAPGSGSYVSKRGTFQVKAKVAHGYALGAMSNLGKFEFSAATQKYRSIYGTNFPSRL